ncbi:MAG TPA: MgtC/SapB family protein [Pseudolabrys sp.]|nr:MgtC/SapB family protein [Pseudolabrys sp.]
MEVSIAETALRLGAAVLAGVAVGLNRDITDKPIGMRTLGLVALGAATITLGTIEFHGLGDDVHALSRVLQGIIQGVLTGIGFIGAGVILRNASAGEIRGLTTAASVWVTAALGIVCGLAAWTVAAVGIILALVLLVLVGWLEDLLHLKDD